MSQMLDYINQMIEDRKALLHASQNSLSDLEDVANDPVLVELLDLRRDERSRCKRMSRGWKADA